MRQRDLISQEDLKKYLHYEPDTGIFTWIYMDNPRTSSRLVGTRAGHVAWNTDSSKNKTYFRRSIGFTLRGKRLNLKEHQMAFLYMLNYIPEMIDHKDGDATRVLQNASQME